MFCTTYRYLSRSVCLSGRRRRAGNIFEQTRFSVLVYLGLCWTRQRLEVSISLLQEWRRFVELFISWNPVVGLLMGPIETNVCNCCNCLKVYSCLIFFLRDVSVDILHRNVRLWHSHLLSGDHYYSSWSSISFSPLSSLKSLLVILTIIITMFVHIWHTYLFSLAIVLVHHHHHHHHQLIKTIMNRR